MLAAELGYAISGRTKAELIASFLEAQPSSDPDPDPSSDPDPVTQNP